MSNFDFVNQIISSNPSNSNNSKDDLRFYKLPSARSSGNYLNTVALRILPIDMNNSDFPFKILLKHFEIPSVSKGVNCLKSWGMDCPVCNVLGKLSEKMDVSRMRAILRPVAQCLILRDPTKQGANPVLPYMTIFTSQVLNVFVDFWRDEAKRTIFDVKAGRNISLIREKDGGRFNLSVDFDRSPIAISDDYISNIMSNRYNLDDIWKQPDDNSLKNYYDISNSLEEALCDRLSLLGNTQQPQQQQQYNTQPPQQQFNRQPQQQYNTQPQQQYNTQPPQQQFNRQPQQQFNRQPAQYTNAQQYGNAQFAQPFNGNAQVPQHNYDDIPFGDRAMNTSPIRQEIIEESFVPSSDAPKSNSISNVVGSPECFGNPLVYDRNSETCISCNFEFQCEKLVSRKS